MLDRPKIVRQQTVEENVDKFRISVKAASKQVAKARARTFLRSEIPTAKNVLDPEVRSRGETEQSSMRQFFPESLKQKDYKVDLLVVR